MARRERLPAKREPPNGQMPAVRPPVLWYLILMLILLWIWQDAPRQVSMHTIPYSEFKSRLARARCPIHDRTGPSARPAYESAKAILSSHREELDLFASELLKEKHSTNRPLTHCCWGRCQPPRSIPLTEQGKAAIEGPVSIQRGTPKKNRKLLDGRTSIQ